ncbi:cysteine desulfurase [Candidatus Woesearchaeota archaeon]|nr:cysteine desulfurase [Candidatus Woesearchaeota archaeon]
MKEIYFDNAATTRIDDEVLKEMIKYFKKEYANASSLHFKGRIAKEAIEKAREIIAKSINAEKEEIIFTSGGTESNNLILKGLFFSNYPEKDHIIVSKIEHDCILNSCKFLEALGAKITYLNVDSEGFVDLEELKKSITEKTFLVSIMHVNNEIGTIQNLEEIGKICKEKNVLFHTDACQSFTKVPIDVKKQNLGLVTLNSHKIHGPKGVGALYVKKGTLITPLIDGGGHENGKRSGTENVTGIVGFGKAVEISNTLNHKEGLKKMRELQEYLIKELSKIPNTRINGPIKDLDKRLCNNINVSFKNIEGESIMMLLSEKGICVSTGSACSSHSLKTSHVLKALNLIPLEANGTIRVSLSKYNTKEEIDYFLKNINTIVKRLRKISPFSD